MLLRQSAAYCKPSFPAFARRGNMAIRKTPINTPGFHVKDVRCATLLSELVYRAAESHDEASFRQAQAKVEEAVGASLRDVRRHKSGGQRFLVGETDEAIYIAFQGTKSAIDWLANLNFFHGHFGWQHHHHHSSSSSVPSSASSISSRSSASTSDSSTSSGIHSSSKSRSSRAHIGFLKRANSAAVSISELHAAAAAAGKRLVLTGHSLGGAVAVLTTVRLLRSLSAEHAQAVGASAAGQPLGEDPRVPHVRCISFATPAMANSDLLQEVTAAGWDQYITNIVMPEDPVVPFVNLLLKAPTSPTQPPALSPRSFFAGLDSPSPSSIGSSSSEASVSAADLSRCNSNDSGLSFSSPSWSSGLTFDPAGLTEELTASFAAAGANAAAALQPLQHHLRAAADCWLAQQGQELSAAQEAADLGFCLAMAGDAAAASAAAASADGAALGASVLTGSTGSQELAAWLAAARGAVKQQAGSQPSQRSFMDSSRCNSNSGNSLCSLTSEAFAQWPAASSSVDESFSSSSSGYRAESPESLASPASHRRGYSFGVPVIASWALESPDSSPISSPSSTAGPESPTAAVAAAVQPLFAAVSSSSSLDVAGSPDKPPEQASEAAAAAAEGLSSGSSSSKASPAARSQVLKQLRRLQQRLSSTKVGRWAWIGGALAAGARCASALAAPAAVTSQPFSLLALFPQALMGPAALAVLHFVGAAAYKAALPASHPLGQQWVMTGAGLEPVAKPLASYPRTGEGLGLKELGGLFPGHRMIAYRRRLATLVSQSAPAVAAVANVVEVAGEQ